MDDKAQKLLARAYDLTGDEAETKALYRDWAATYDATMISELNYLSPTVVAKAARSALPTDARLLDVGCGTGLLGEALHSVGFTQINGLDYSDEMLAVARSKGAFVELHQIDLNGEISLQRVGYDAVVSCGTFTHGHVDAGCIPALIEVLKPGGWFIATVHQDLWQTEGFEKAFGDAVSAGSLSDLTYPKFKLFADDPEPTGLLVQARKL